MPPTPPRDTKKKRELDRKAGTLNRPGRDPKYYSPSSGTLANPKPPPSAPSSSAPVTVPSSSGASSAFVPKGIPSLFDGPGKQESLAEQTAREQKADQTRRAEEARKSEKAEREREARRYRREQIAKAAAKHLQEVEVLVPKTNERGEAIPLEGVSLDDYKRARKELNQRLKKITAAATPRSQTRGSVEMRELEAQNEFVQKVFEHDVQTAAAFKTSKEEWTKAEKKINKRAKKIKAGKWSPPKPEEPMLAGLPQVVKAFKDAADAVSGAYDKIPGSEIKPMGIGSNPNVPTPGQIVAKTFDLLTRPADAMRTQVARMLVDAGAIKGTTATKIRNAKDPLEAFLNKNDEKQLVHGSDVTQGLFSAPKAGIVVDILTDPLMYLGAGAARMGASEAVKAAQLASRIEKAGVATYDGQRLANMTRLATESGDFKALEATLRDVAKKGGVDVSDLGKTGADKFIAREVTGRAGVARRTKAFFGNKAAQREVEKIQDAANFGAVARQKETLRQASAMRAEDPGIRTGALRSDAHAPTHFGLRGVKEAGAWALRNQYRPGAEIRLLSPLGRRVAGLRVPLPSSFRTGLYGKSLRGMKLDRSREGGRGRELHDMREARITAEVRAQYADELEAAHRRLERIEANPTAAESEVRAAERAIRELDGKVNRAIGEALTADRRPLLRGGGGTASIGELTELRNRRQFAHKVNQQATNFERDAQSQWMKLVDAAIAPVNADAHALARVTFAMAERSGSGTRHLPPLSPKEEEVVRNLQQVADRLRESGVRAGVLDRYLADKHYLPRQFTNQVEPSIFARTQMSGEELRSTGQGVGQQQHGRSEFELFSKANPEKTASQIAEAYGIPLDRARETVEQIFDAGRIRTTTNLLARQVQRQGALDADSLTPLQQRAVDGWDRSRAKGEGGHRLFDDPADNEGLLMLSKDAEEVYEVSPTLYDSLPAEQAVTEKLAAVDEDIAQLTRMVDDTLESDPGLSKAWQAHLKQLHHEREEILGVVDEIRTIKAGAQGEVPDEIVLKATKSSKRGTPQEWEWGPYKVRPIKGRKIPEVEREAAAKAVARRERRAEIKDTRYERRTEARKLRRAKRQELAAQERREAQELAAQEVKAREEAAEAIASTEVGRNAERFEQLRKSDPDYDFEAYQSGWSSKDVRRGMSEDLPQEWIDGALDASFHEDKWSRALEGKVAATPEKPTQALRKHLSDYDQSEYNRGWRSKRANSNRPLEWQDGFHDARNARSKWASPMERLRRRERAGAQQVSFNPPPLKLAKRQEQKAQERITEKVAKDAAKDNGPPPTPPEPPAKNPTRPGSFTHGSYPQLRSALTAHETPELKGILDNWQDFGAAEVKAFAAFSKRELADTRSWLARPEYREARTQVERLREELKTQIRVKSGSAPSRVAAASPTPDQLRTAARKLVSSKEMRKVANARRPEMFGKVTRQRKVRNVADHLGIPVQTPAGTYRSTEDLLDAIGREMDPARVAMPPAKPRAKIEPDPPQPKKEPTPAADGALPKADLSGGAEPEITHVQTSSAAARRDVEAAERAARENLPGAHARLRNARKILAQAVRQEGGAGRTGRTKIDPDPAKPRTKIEPDQPRTRTEIVPEPDLQPLSLAGVPMRGRTRRNFEVELPDGSAYRVNSLEDAKAVIHEEASKRVAQLDNQIPYKPTGEYSQALKDPRYEGEALQAIANPREAYAWRTRSEARNVADRGRYEAIDTHAGRDFAETKTQYFSTHSGDTYGMSPEDFGRMDRIKPHYDPDDPSVLLGYEVRETGDVIPLDDFNPEKRALVRMGGDETSKGAIWIDVNTGREYIRADQAADLLASGYTGETEKIRQAILKATGSRQIGSVEVSTRLWPTDVVRDMRAERFRMGDYDLVYKTGLGTAFAKTMENIRYGVTTLFPAFHTRNMISDLLMSIQADSGILFHPIATAKMAALAMGRENKLLSKLPGAGYVNVPGWGKMKNEDFLLLMDLFGNRSNMQVADLMLRANSMIDGARDARRSIRYSGQRAGAVTDFFNPTEPGGFMGLGRTGKIGHTAQEFSSRREDIMRMATLLQRMRRNGGDVADASWHMISVHFDYGDLSKVERLYIRNVFLFYTWYRRNIPRQLWQIVHRPGFFNAVGYGYDNLFRGTSPLNQDWSKIHEALPNMEGQPELTGLVPEYMWHLSPVTMSWNGHTLTASYGAPWADLGLLNQLTDWSGGIEGGIRTGLLGLGQLVNPVITQPATQVFRKDVLTGREFREDETGGAANIAAWIADKFGVEFPEDKYGRPVLPWRLNAFLSQVPMFGRASSYTMTDAPSTQDQGRISTGWGRFGLRFLGGINVRVTPKNAKPGESQRLDEAWITRLMGFGYARQKLSMDLSNRKDADKAKRLDAFDNQVEKWMRENKAPEEYWPIIRNLGPRFYETVEEKAAKEKMKQAASYGLSQGTSGTLDTTWGSAAVDKKKKPSKRKDPVTESRDKLLGKDEKKDDKPKGTLSLGIEGASFAPVSFVTDGVPAPPEGGPDFSEAAKAVAEVLHGDASGTDRLTPEPEAKDEPAPPAKKKDLVDPADIPRKRKVKLAKRILQLRREIRQGVGGSGKVPSGVPERFRGLVAKYAPLVDDKAKDYGLTGAEFLAKMLKGESNFGQTEVGPDTRYGNARGPAQFIPGTRQDFIDKFGIDPWRSDEEAVKAMAYHLDGKHYGVGGIQGYNPGINDDYYLNQDVGELVEVKGAQNEKQLQKKKEQLKALVERGHEWGIFDVPKGGDEKPSKTLWKQPKRAFKNQLGITDGMDPLLDGQSEEIMELGRTIARSVNHPVTINSAYRPEQGYDSDHLHGRALDLHALAVRYGDEDTQRKGDEIAAAAIRAAGGTEEQVKAMIENEGTAANAISIQSPNGKRVQIIWKSDVGGNHWNHVHVGIDPADADPKTFVDRSKPLSIMQQVKADREMARLTNASSSSSSSSSSSYDSSSSSYDSSSTAPSAPGDFGLSFGLTDPNSTAGSLLGEITSPGGGIVESDETADHKPAIRGRYRGGSLLPNIARDVERIVEASNRRKRLLNLR